MRDRFERDIEAYRDGALPERKLRRVEEALAVDAEAARHLRQSEALGRLVRESWLEGPPAPPAERILAAIGSELHRIDQERARRAWRLPWRDWSSSWLRPAALGWAGALAAGLLVIASGVLGPGTEFVRDRAGLSTGSVTTVATARPFGPFLPEDDHLAERQVVPSERISTASPLLGFEPRGIYDLYQGDGAGLLVYDGRDDSPIMIFTLPEGGDDLSLGPLQYGGWA